MTEFFDKKPLLWILEDDASVIDIYQHTLVDFYNVNFITSFAEFNQLITDRKHLLEQPDLLVIDLTLKDGHFFDYVEKNPNFKNLNFNFVVISGNHDLDTLRDAYKLGAKDYLVKPIKINELIVKIEQRLHTNDKTQLMKSLSEKSLTFDGIKIENLTSKQMQMLSLFMTSRSRTVNRDDLIERIWGRINVHPKTLDVHIYNLRRKLGEYGLVIRAEGNGNWQLISSTRTPEQYV